MKKYILFLMVLCCTALGASAASRIVKGTVTSAEDGFMLIGATVYVDGKDLQKVGAGVSTQGSVTDVDGNFELSIPEGITRFYCSYLGHETQEVKLVSNKDTYQIVLQPTSQMLEGVVVTGYQTIEKRRLTAAVSKVELSDAITGSAKSIDQALTGQIAGMQVMSTTGDPGAPAKIRIRGTASMNGTQDPLWVLDGIPLEGTDIPNQENSYDIENIKQSSIAGINPSDIEDITVLKDAAATAIYGARAANGVIVITTKSGKQGKPRVNFSTRLTLSPRRSLSRLNLMNSSEKVDLELGLLRSNFTQYEDKGGVYRTLNDMNLLDAYKENGDAALTPDAIAALDRLRNQNTNWNNLLFQNVFNQEYNVNISGGGEKVTYYNSFGFFEENGNIRGVKNNRFSLVSKTSYRINNMFKVGASIFATRRSNNRNYPSNYGYTNANMYARRVNPYYKPLDEHGKYVYDYDIQNQSATDLGFNILEERENSFQKETINSLSSIFDFEFRLDDHFKVTSQLGVQIDNASKEEMASGETFVMRNTRKNSQYWDKASEGYKYFIPEGGVHKAYNNANTQITWKTMAEYRNSWNDIHDVQIMAGTELRKTKNTSDFGAGYGYDPVTLTTKPIIFPDEAKAKNYPLHNNTLQENAYVSFFSTMSYTLLNRYTFGGSVRMDGSDLYGVAKKYRYLPLYSVSGLWRISQEKFLYNAASSWLDNLAIRLSYGLQGNIDKNTSPFLIGTYKVETILPGGSEYMIDLDGAPNAKLRWEKTHSVNAGLDFAVLNNRINFSADYYYRKGVDLIGLQMLPLESGFTSATINWASMVNKGIELSLSTRNIVTKDFTWSTNFNFSYNNNKVLREVVADNSYTPSREGYPVGAIFGFKTAGLDDQGYPLFLNKEGEKVSLTELYRLQDEWGIGLATTDVTAKEEREFVSYLGTKDAPYAGGLINTLSYKDWELSFNFSYMFGGKVKTMPSYDIIDFDRGWNHNTDILNRWTPENPNSKLPALMSSADNPLEHNWYSSRKDIYNNLDIWIKDLAFLRLQNLRLAYNVPKTFLQKLRINSATVALEGRNLFVVGANYKNYLDPESMDNPYASAIPRSFTFNLNLSF